MRSILAYVAQNTVELLFMLSATVLLYSLVRRFGAPLLVALTFSGFPVMAVWAYRNALAGGVMNGLF